jgi:hypothetical protein
MSKEPQHCCEIRIERSGAVSCGVCCGDPLESVDLGCTYLVDLLNIEFTFTSLLLMLRPTILYVRFSECLYLVHKRASRTGVCGEGQ